MFRNKVRVLSRYFTYLYLPNLVLRTTPEAAAASLPSSSTMILVLWRMFWTCRGEEVISVSSAASENTAVTLSCFRTSARFASYSTVNFGTRKSVICLLTLLM